jgi:hypothetical protein
MVMTARYMGGLLQSRGDQVPARPSSPVVLLVVVAIEGVALAVLLGLEDPRCGSWRGCW